MDKNKVAYNLKTLRGNKAREVVANDLGLSVSALQMYENAQRVPRDETKIKIADYYGVSVQDIFFEEQNHNSCCLNTSIG